MKHVLISGFAALTLVLAMPSDAEPCGVKLKLKTPKTKSLVTLSAQPGRVLMLAVRSSSLQHGLSEAGHKVDQSSSSSARSNQKYSVVVTNKEHAKEASDQWPKAKIVVATSSTKVNLALVEHSLNPTDESQLPHERGSKRRRLREAKQSKP